MANVWDAMKKHEAEKAAAPGDAPAPAPAPQPAAPPPQAATPVPASPKAAAAARYGTQALNGYAPDLVAHHDRGSAATEEYRSLRTHLLTHYAEERFCLLLTSTVQGEGKTVTCLNLALVLAERQERRVVVIDCDLRKRRVADLMRIPNTPGLAECVRDGARLEDVTQPTHYRNLFVIPAGDARQNEVGDILGRPELEDLIEQLRQRYDYVLVDTPPITEVPDAGVLGKAVHDAVLVVRMNKTRRESADHAIGLLHAANIKPIGIALTHHRRFIPKKIYYRL